MDYKEQIDTLNAWGGALTTATGRQIGMYFREAAQSITDLLTRAEIAEYELAQKDEYYEQMTDALAGLSSKELEETKQKLKSTETRAKQAEYERDAALADLIRAEQAAGEICQLLDNEVHPINLAILEIEEAPTADVAPVVHGRWVEDERTYPGPGLKNNLCSVCGEIAGSWKEGLEPGRKWAYCPNCGALMDGGKSNGKT